MERLKSKVTDFNVQDIMELPCVVSCEKHFTETNEPTYVYTLFNGQRAHTGEWIVETLKGWRVMTRKEYESYQLLRAKAQEFASATLS